MSLSRYEQETIINYNEEEKEARIYTHNKAMRCRLEKLAQLRPEECRIERTSEDGKAADFVVPKAWIKIRPKRILSTEEREARCEKLKKYRFLPR